MDKNRLWWKNISWKAWMCYVEIDDVNDSDDWCYLGGHKLNKVKGTCEGCSYRVR
jgi:hypothetical protein